jgi:hypothetical protein
MVKELPARPDDLEGGAIAPEGTRAMHPELLHQAHQAHVDDLRREADRQRRDARHLRRRARGTPPSFGPLLSPAVRDVLVFAEHRPTPRQLEQVLEQLQDLRDDVVTALMHHRPVATSEVVDHGGRPSVSLPSPGARIPAQRTPPAAEQQLTDVIGALRAAGHDACGELVAGSPTRVLSARVRERHPDAVILLTDRHRLAHLARRDMERRLRRQTSVPVIVVGADRDTAVV